MHKTESHRFFSKGKKLSFVRLLVSLGLASVSTVWSLYMSGFGLSDSAIGFVSSFLIMLGFASSVFSSSLFARFRLSRLFVASMLGAIVFYGLIGTMNSLALFLAASVLIAVFGTVRTLCFDIIFKYNTELKELNKEQGFMYSVLNLGWLVGPLIAGAVLAQYGIEPVFLVAAGFFTLGLFSYLAIKPTDSPKYELSFAENSIANVREFVKNQKMRLPYLMAAGVGFWWSLVYVYVPLFLVHQGLRAPELAVFLSALVLPLIALESLVGKLSAVYGFRFFSVIGFSGLAVLSLGLFLSTSLYQQMTLLWLASLFMAFVEPLQDTFFFKQVKPGEEEKAYPIFGTSYGAGSFVGKVSVAGVLLFLPERFAYLTVFVFVLFFALVATRIPKELK